MTDPKTFSLKDALAGISFPEDKVTIFLDAGLMYEYCKALRDRDYDPMNEEKKEKVAELEDLFKDIALTITVKDMPNRIRQDAKAKVRKEFPPETNMLGMHLDTPEGQDEINVQMWALYITSITSPGGTVISPSPDDIRLLRDEAPDIALNAIKEKIDGLTDITKAGYEAIVKGPDFLSQPSQTESPDSITP